MPLTNTTDDRRNYHSPLRQQQAQATRDRILAGLARTMADGVAEVSMPAVAEAAGVSVATVYRHFPTKRALFEALPGYFARLVGMDRPSLPSTPVEFENTIRRLFSMYEQVGDVARAAMASQLGDKARKIQMPKRLRP
jgi:AcrR family transcriptional regulator